MICPESCVFCVVSDYTVWTGVPVLYGIRENHNIWFRKYKIKAILVTNRLL